MLGVQYPVFDICKSCIVTYTNSPNLLYEDPAVYPFNLDNVYPPVDPQESNPELAALGSKSAYPNLVICESDLSNQRIVGLLSSDPEIAGAVRASDQDEAEQLASARTRRPTLVLNVAGLPSPRSVGKVHSRGFGPKSSQQRTKVPPVPPLPQNVARMRPISPATRLPMTGERIGMSLPVHLPFTYPTICPCSCFICTQSMTRN